MRSASSAGSAIWAERLAYVYSPESEPVLRDVSLEIPRGQLVAVLGANGSGKSTFAMLVAGLLHPSSGSLRILSGDWSDSRMADELRRRIGIVFQSPDQQMVATTLEREIAFGPENLGLPSAEIRTRVRSMMRQFRLEPLSGRLPHQLSGGEKQRLALAAVLAMQPELLILDEVTSLLDPYDRKEVLRDIGKMKGQRTIILITQFSDEALPADRVLLMHEGRIMLDGAPLDVFGHATTSNLFGVETPLIHRLLQIVRTASTAS